MTELGSILTAMVTPFDADGRVDEDAAVALMNHLVEHGSDGLVICGTTGEASTLNDEEHLGMIRLAVQEMKGRASIVAGVGSNDTRHAIHLTEKASEIGPDANGTSWSSGARRSDPCCRMTTARRGAFFWKTWRRAEKSGR